MKKSQLFLLSLCLFLCPILLSAQVQEGTQLGNWQNESLPQMAFGRYNDVWGVVVNGVEYAVIGSTMGVHFISLEPDNGELEEVAFAPGAAQGSSIIHRDFHSYQNYLYVVADEGSSSTLQIIDFSDLPNEVTTVYDSNEFITTAHNIFIDEPNARLYSTNGKVLSLADPANPTLLGTGPIQGHDIFVRDHILYANKGNSGLFVYDYTDASNPQLIGSMTDYENQGYNHAGWLSEDGSHYFLCDETGGAFVKSVDVTDYSDIKVVDMFKADNDNQNHIAHNAMVRGNLLFVSYYSDGLQVFDVTDPTRVVRKAYYDTYPGVNNSGFKGAWGVYSDLPSGRILISDMSTGLYLLEMPVDETLFVLDEDVRACVDQAVSFDVLVGADFDNNGLTMSVSNLPSGVTASFSPDPVMPNDIVTVLLDPIGVVGDLPLTIVAEDVDAIAMGDVEIEIVAPAEAVALNTPADGELMVSLSPTFSWVNTEETVTLEVSSYADFSTIDIASVLLDVNIYQLPDMLDQFTTYYWRVTTNGECGDVVSDEFSFTTFPSLATKESVEAAFSIYPNPANESFFINSEEMLNGNGQVALFDLQGKVLQSWNVEGYEATQEFRLSNNLNGVYLIRIVNEEHVVVRKISVMNDKQ